MITLAELVKAQLWQVLEFIVEHCGTLTLTGTTGRHQLERHYTAELPKQPLEGGWQWPRDFAAECPREEAALEWELHLRSLAQEVWRKLNPDEAAP